MEINSMHMKQHKSPAPTNKHKTKHRNTTTTTNKHKQTDRETSKKTNGKTNQTKRTNIHKHKQYLYKKMQIPGIINPTQA